MELFQFQQVAAATIASRCAEYLDDPVTGGRGANKHLVPFFQSLSSLTGSGKTLILAAAANQVAAEMPVPPVILWLSRGKVVVQQSFSNLSPGGRYHHILGNMAVAALADYSPEDVASSTQPLVYFATVGTFNQKDKEGGTLRIHKSDVDTMEQSVWTALRLRLTHENVRRPLVVVYDEAQNLSDQQTELLLGLEPDVFLPASATMRIPQVLDKELGYLRNADYDDNALVTKVPTAEAVNAGLVKTTVRLEGYNAPLEETITSLLAKLEETSAALAEAGESVTPKAIYVCETNVIADNPGVSESPKQPFSQRQAPPIQIWRYLTEQCGIDPATVAVYADLKVDKDHPLPDDFKLFNGGDKDYSDFSDGDYQHIIFNLRLQEGWDDPSVYFAYIDKSMGSRIQITQIIGRVLRQPNAKRLPSELLNTANLYVRVDKNDVFAQVVAEVEAELGGEAGGIRISSSAPGKPKADSLPALHDLTVPHTGLNPKLALQRVQPLMDAFPDYREDTTNTRGVGKRKVVRQRVGAEAASQDWEVFEQSSTMSARWIFTREVSRQYAQALGVVNQAEAKLDATIGVGSPAYHQVCTLAEQVVDTYVKNVRLSQRKDNPYKVGAITARPGETATFENAAHAGYSGLRASNELPFAKALDVTGMIWARNPDRVGYGIPLITPGPTRNFYPDFLVWTPQRVVCIDTKGQHLVMETAARKLLKINYPGTGPRLDVQFVTPGRYSDTLEQRDSEGFSAWSLNDDGRISATHFGDLQDVVTFLLDDELHVVGE